MLCIMVIINRLDNVEIVHNPNQIKHLFKLRAKQLEALLISHSLS